MQLENLHHFQIDAIIFALMQFGIDDVALIEFMR
jgi:hypothetical protein